MSHKDVRISALTAEILRLDSVIEGVASESDDRARTIERLDGAIRSAMEDLRALQHVPAGQLLACVSEIIGYLKAAID